MNTELYGIGEKYMSENKTIEQAKQELLDNINAGDLSESLARAYKTLCEAQMVEVLVKIESEGFGDEDELDRYAQDLISH